MLQRREPPLDPPDELVDLGLGIRRAGERECGLRAVAPAVDAGEVLAHEHPGVAIARGDLGDPRLVELEVQVDVDLEEVLRAAGLGVEARRGLPRPPSAIVQRRRGDHGLARLELAPELRERARDERVIDLHHDLGALSNRMDDHRTMYPPSTTSAAPIVELEPGAAR